MIPLKWSTNQFGNYNGKVGRITLVTICWHTEKNSWFVAPKLPGLLKSIPVGSVEEGKAIAAKIYEKFFRLLSGT